MSFRGNRKNNRRRGGGSGHKNYSNNNNNAQKWRGDDSGDSSDSGSSVSHDTPSQSPNVVPESTLLSRAQTGSSESENYIENTIAGVTVIDDPPFMQRFYNAVQDGGGKSAKTFQSNPSQSHNFIKLNDTDRGQRNTKVPLNYDEQDHGWLNDDVLADTVQQILYGDDSEDSDSQSDVVESDSTDSDDDLSDNYPDSLFDATDTDKNFLGRIDGVLRDNSAIGATSSDEHSKEYPRLPFVDYEDLHLKIVQLLGDPNMTHLSLQPMPNFLRRLIHEFCNNYNLNTTSHGQGSQRFIIIEKYPNSCLPASASDEKEFVRLRIEESVRWKNIIIIKQTQLHVNSQDFIGRQKTKSKYQNLLKAYQSGIVWWPTEKSATRNQSTSKIMRKRDKQLRKTDKKFVRNNVAKSVAGRRSGDRQKTNRPSGSGSLAAGAIVGGDAQPISESNRGHRLLMKMGWTPGDGIGAVSSSASSIKVPIEAVMPKVGRGLGYGND